MRLYLSSFRLGHHSDRLLELTGPRAHVAVIANALDAGPDNVRRTGVDRELNALRTLGFRADELDLRGSGSVGRLQDYEAVWVRGGNSFVLRRAMADAGADRVLRELIRADALVYAGYSAGPVVLAPTLRGIEQVDDVAAVTEPIWDGLGVIDRPFVPHVESPGHPGTAGCDRLSAHLTRSGTSHWALRDGEVLLFARGHIAHLRQPGSPP